MGAVDANLISQAEYARLRGVSREAVRRAIGAGRISAFGPDKLVNRELADSQWRQNTRARVSATTPAVSAPEPTATSTDGDYWANRARREAAEAELAELKLEETRGSLVRADAVRAALAKRATAFRESLLQLAPRLAATLAAETDRAKIHALLDAEHRAALALLTAGD